MDKTEQLLALANKRKTDHRDGYKNIGEVNGIYECDYVSPYSKSAHNEDADVMIFLQDWSSEDSLKILISEEEQAIEIECGHTPKLPTNKNLKKLLKEHLQLDLSQTYVTNLFPLIKPGGISARISMKDMEWAAKEYSLPQIDIIEPKIIICLGKNTYNSLRKALGKESLATLKECIESPSIKYKGSNIFCQAHTGAWGQNFRNKHDKNRVRRDWVAMVEFIK